MGTIRSEFEQYVDKLSCRHDLQLQQMSGNESPSRYKRRTNATVSSCLSLMRFLWYKGQDGLHEAIAQVDSEAYLRRQGWVCKPGADHDLLPQSNGAAHISIQQRAELLNLLHKNLSVVKERVQIAIVPRQLTKSKSEGYPSGRTTTSKNVPLSFTFYKDNPIPIDPILQRPRVTSKRRSNEFDDLADNFDNDGKGSKKSCHEHNVTTIEDLKVKTLLSPRRTELIPKAAESSLSWNRSWGQPPAANISGTDTTHHQTTSDTNSKSFTSTNFTSTVSAVFSDNVSDRSFSSQSTAVARSSTQDATQDHQSSDFGSSFPAAAIEEALSSEGRNSGDLKRTAKVGFCGNQSGSIGNSVTNSDLGELTSLSTNTESQYPSLLKTLNLELPYTALRSRLKTVFPSLSPSCADLELHIKYEILRVCLHTGVSPLDIRISQDHAQQIRSPDELWGVLDSLPGLQNKEFPDKSSIEAWKACSSGFSSIDSRAVILSGSLAFSELQTGPLYCFRLNPLRLEQSHRLGRRFGNQRFFELAIPATTGDKLPRILLDANNCPDAVLRDILLDWLSNAKHSLLGKEWQSFFGKDVGSRKKGSNSLLEKQELSPACTHRLYLFAAEVNTPAATGNVFVPESTSSLINWLIEPSSNSSQPYLKLYSRIALGLSKTEATIVFEQSDIDYQETDLHSISGEVMNDGCGRVSETAARKIATLLGIPMYEKIPSAFQARIGGAKGLWLVDRSSKDNTIEIYPTQTKWQLSYQTGANEVEEAHRTFEVCDWSKPTKSAHLNLQILPILMEQAKSRSQMARALERKLEDNLTYEFDAMSAAMDSAESFRSWVRSNNANLEERIKNGGIAFIGGRPSNIPEVVNLCLESGFDPARDGFLRDQIWQLQKMHCERLQEKMSVMVGRSCYVFCVPDFTGTLAENEVHLAFSSPFIDERSCFNDDHVEGPGLVTRSPAHIGSDIQRINFVYKSELRHYKDIAIFSIRGRKPLAGKLSGGDYDGDTVWCCWDPDLVEPFRNASDPIFPDLVARGYLTKNKTTYAELTQQTSDPITKFLRKSLDFNLEANRLGSATVYKEKVAYKLNSMSGPRIVALTALLSDLVDQYKQGFSMTDAQWQDFIGKEIAIERLFVPAYKDNIKPSGEQLHIIDRLKFVTAANAIEKNKKRLHHSFDTKELRFDADLVQRAKNAQIVATTCQEMQEILEQLIKDMEAVQQQYSRLILRSMTSTGKIQLKSSSSDQDELSWAEKLATTYKAWKDIIPCTSGPISTLLLPSSSTKSYPDCHSSTTVNSEYSAWELLKASIYYDKYQNKKFLWWMAARQLCFMKAECSKGGSRLMIESMYCTLKPDNMVIKRRRAAADKARRLGLKDEEVDVGGISEEEEDGFQSEE